MVKIANDLRWMGSGPRAGIGEIHLPDLQPGSSIMPGKVNPVVPEATVQVAAQVIGNDAAIAFAGAQGNFDLLVMLPVMAQNLLESINILGNVAQVLAKRTIDGLVANVERCLELAESSPSIVTPLNRHIGYENAAKIAKHSVKENITVKQAAIDLGFVERGEIDEETLNKALDVTTMVGER
ncbi:lyase family protein [Trueperella pyogenes]